MKSAILRAPSGQPASKAERAEQLHKLKRYGMILRVIKKPKMKQKTGLTRYSLLPLALMTAVFGFSVISRPLVLADRFDDQINALRDQNSQNSAARAQLGAEAATLADTVAKLQQQIDTLQAQINANQAKSDDLQRQITEAQAELDRQKAILGENIKAMYLEGQISTLEMLASSKDLSDFVDKQEYRNSVSDKIKTTVQKITDLKQQLAKQKQEVEQLLVDQRAMNVQLDAQRAEQATLLAANESQQADLSAQIKSNNSQISDLRRQQAIENARYNIGSMKGDPNNGGYPTVWANAPQDSLIDNWGMYNRECVSFTAWKVWNSGRHMPYWGGYGNANQWDDNARAEGIPVDTNPREGDVAISNSGPFGHAMYVEAVGGNGTIYVSQYNAQLNGQYSEGWRYTTGLVFIHFP